MFPKILWSRQPRWPRAWRDATTWATAKRASHSGGALPFLNQSCFKRHKESHFETFTPVQFIDHYYWIVGYPPSAASLGCNDVLCQWKFIVFSSRDNKLLLCCQGLFLGAHLTLFSALCFQNTHLYRCWIAQKNAEDVTIRWRRVSENFQ